MDPQVWAPVRFERFGNHFRPQVRPADADIDYIGDGLAGIALPASGSDQVTKGSHFGQHPVDLRHHVLTVNQDGAIGPIAESHVEHGPIFGGVDLLPAEHGLDLATPLLR